MTEVIGVRFRGGCKEYYFDPHGIAVEPNQFVIVETAQGLEYAHCVSGNHEVEDDAVIQPLRPLVRVATENDDRTYAYNKSREKNAFEVCQKKILERGLDMKLVRVESNFDGSQDAESEPEPDEDLRHVRPSHVLPQIRAERL